ncbi:MAG TPA: 4'-phosphopantetheinyl transferase superfamily protein [Candidatus Angelobacter sp.]|jgi:4'-phosphopantetheinyl transferase|nr:4'-phosphopantetheinyl transferase superfamily protein [Candidatus Angelobacter sp.]
MLNDAQDWVAPVDAGSLGPRDVDVWRIGLVQPEAVIQHYREFLAAIEIERADRFYFAKDRNRFTVARGVMRQLLGRYLGVGPHEIEFAYGPHGKPSLAAPQDASDIRFNLSHSGEIALLAVARNVELGVDVEQIRADFATGEIATRFFSPEECAKLASLPADETVGAFFNCWTRKEAYIKARGEGLFIPLDSFEVAFAPGEEAALLQVKSGDEFFSRWRFHALHPGAGYKAALAVEGSDHGLRLWDWNHRSTSQHDGQHT